MKTEKVVTAVLEESGGWLGSHAFLDQFALAFHSADGDAFGSEELASLEEWRRILGEADANRLVEIITDASDEGQRLRSSSPFGGALSPEQRLKILAACEQRATV